MIVLPSLIGVGLNQMSKGKLTDIISKPLSPFSKIGIAVTPMLNSAVVAPYLGNINGKLIAITVVVLFLIISGYVISFFTGSLLNYDRDTIISLMFTCGIRNISAGAVIAISYFPAAVAVPVLVGLLFQQVLASYLLNALWNMGSLQDNS